MQLIYVSAGYNFSLSVHKKIIFCFCKSSYLVHLLSPKNFKAMTTQEAVLTTQEVAARFDELAKENRWDLIVNELYDAGAVSIEPAGSQLPNAEGLPAIKKKGDEFNAMIEEMHGGWCSPPVVGGNYFSVGMGMDVTMKGAGRMNMDEICVYEVKNGKIVKEQFFY